MANLTQIDKIISEVNKLEENEKIIFFHKIRKEFRDDFEHPEKLRSVWLKRLNNAINLSLKEEFPDISRPMVMREPVDLTD